MENSGLNDGSFPGEGSTQTNAQETKKQSIQRCIQSIVHSCQCKDTSCSLLRCKKIKRVVQHMRICKKKSHGGCPVCKQFIVLCCYHAKDCQETAEKCLMPFCPNIKEKIKQKQLQERLQERRLLQRRNEMMNIRMDPATTSGPGGGGNDDDAENSGLNDGSSLGDGSTKTNPQETTIQAVLRCVQSLVHSRNCKDADCSFPNCQKMKRVAQHMRQCKRKTNGGCPICRQLVGICIYHAKYCQNTKCIVPFCPNIKKNLKKKQLQDVRLQQQRLWQRRMAMLIIRMAKTTLLSPGPSGESNNDDATQ